MGHLRLGTSVLLLLPSVTRPHRGSCNQSGRGGGRKRDGGGRGDGSTSYHPIFVRDGPIDQTRPDSADQTKLDYLTKRMQGVTVTRGPSVLEPSTEGSPSPFVV